MLVTVVWGSTFFIIKDTVETINPFFLVMGRNTFAAVLMFAWLFFNDRKAVANKKAIMHGAVLGFLLSLTYTAQTIGLQYTSSGHSAFITGSAVVIVPIIMAILYKVKIKLDVMLIIAIVFTGLFFLTYDTETSINIGDIITLITTFAYAMHLIYSGRSVKNSHVTALITYQFVFASIFSFIAFLVTGAEIGIASPKALWAIAYLGVIGTLFCYFISVWVQKYVSSVNVAIIFSLEPVFAALFAYWAVAEVLNAKELLGAIIITLGVILFQVKDRVLLFIRSKV